MKVYNLIHCIIILKGITYSDGNGGLYSALHPLIHQLSSKGVKYIHVYSVDNVLCKVL